MLADIDSWALHYIETSDLSVKIAPPPLPTEFCAQPVSRNVVRPGRPAELRPAKKGERLPKLEALREPLHRARVLHAFWHHELQAAELMCWALLAFPDTPQEFKRGLLRICFDEIRHMSLYQRHIEALGHHVGEFGIRDWFWTRVPSCPDAVSFVAVMGMGLEAANIEHAPRFSARFREVGDVEGAELQDVIAHDELAHVKFATQWFTHWTGGCDFEHWISRLPPPWSPYVLRGEPLAIEARARAGMPPEFIAALRDYVPDPKGRAV